MLPHGDAETFPVTCPYPCAAPGGPYRSLGSSGAFPIVDLMEVFFLPSCAQCWSLPISLSHWLLLSSPLCLSQTTMGSTLVSFAFSAIAVGYGFRAAIACLEEACMMAATHTWLHSLGATHTWLEVHSLASLCVLFVGFACVPCVGFASLPVSLPGCGLHFCVWASLTVQYI